MAEGASWLGWSYMSVAERNGVGIECTGPLRRVDTRSTYRCPREGRARGILVLIGGRLIRGHGRGTTHVHLRVYK